MVFQWIWCTLGCWDYLRKGPEIYFRLCFPIDLMRYGLLGLSLKDSRDLFYIVFSNGFDALWAVGIISERVPRSNLYCVSQSMWCALGCWDYLRKRPQVQFILCFPIDLMRFGLLGLSPKESPGAIYIVFSNGFDALGLLRLSPEESRDLIYIVSSNHLYVLWAVGITSQNIWSWIRKLNER